MNQDLKKMWLATGMMMEAAIMVPSRFQKTGFAEENIGVIFIFWKKNLEIKIFWILNIPYARHYNPLFIRNHS